jgi:hypothetical protein
MKYAVRPGRGTHASPETLDYLRARALRGDALREVPDARREWVWRSLLKGVRIAEALDLAEMSEDEFPRALDQVRRRYEHRLEDYKRHIWVRKPATRPAPSSRESAFVQTVTSMTRRGWWPFGGKGRED